MGLIKKCFSAASEVITLGGASRLEEAKCRYQFLYEQYAPLAKKADELCETAKQECEFIGIHLKEAKNYLEKAESVVRENLGKLPSEVNLSIDRLAKVEDFNKGFTSALHIGAGMASGGTLAIGSWALVATLGSASTGTAITTLSGVAATNATLAWFGGGALAAGGAGMSGGMAVLGGIAVLPVIYFATKGTYKKAKEFEEASSKLQIAISEVTSRIETDSESVAAIKAKRIEIQSVCNEFIQCCIKLFSIVRPYGFFSQIRQHLMLSFGREPFNSEQIEAIRLLTEAMHDFVNFFEYRNLPLDH